VSRLRVVLVGAAAAILLLAAFSLWLPGLHVRSLLGLSEGLVPCEPRSDRVRAPERPAGLGRWRRAAGFPVARDELRATAARGRIYVGGGVDPGDGPLGLVSTAEFFEFDPARDTYRALPTLPLPVDHAAFVEHAGAVYSVGGWSDGHPIADVFRYDPVQERWTRVASLPRPRAAAAATVLEGRLYVVGGSEATHLGSDLEPSSVLEIYDFASGAWSLGPAMPTSRHHHGAAALDGSLYVAGGRGRGDLSLATFERFDPARRRWERLAALPLGAGGIALVAANGRIIAVGGGDDAEGWVTPATWAYAPAEDRWRPLADLGVARHGHAAVAFGDRLYVFGGSPCPGYGRTDAVETLVVH
jgi:N-acetylneuraminic acid mutarotase